MKREKKKYNQSTVRGIYPLIFWKQCCVCRDEFLREDMWKFHFNEFTFNNIRSVKGFICTTCAPCIDEAQVISNKQALESNENFGLPKVSTLTPMPKCKPPKGKPNTDHEPMTAGKEPVGSARRVEAALGKIFPPPPKGRKRDIPKPPPVLNRRASKHSENGF